MHDELQYESTPECAEDLKFYLELAAVEAGEYYNLRCPIAAEEKNRKQLGRSTLMTYSQEPSGYESPEFLQDGSESHI